MTAKPRQYYLHDVKALVFFNENASASFWDKHWQTENLKSIVLSCKSDPIFIPYIKKYLKKGSIVLEGGCGRGRLVNALKHNGYHAIGIDFAVKTVKAVNNILPELDIRLGDVRNLPFGDCELDGYISAGVVEHFWGGYDQIIKEMVRTIKPGGYLFISFPYMSLLRRIKVALHRYPVSTKTAMENKSDDFYQFALYYVNVEKKLRDSGFTLVQRKPFDGIKGFKDEISLFKPLLQPIYDGKYRLFKSPINNLLKPFASHMIMLIMKKT